MVHESIVEDTAILECAKCGRRSFVTAGERKHKCQFCDHVEVIGGGKHTGTKAERAEVEEEKIASAVEEAETDGPEEEVPAEDEEPVAVPRGPGRPRNQGR